MIIYYYYYCYKLLLLFRCPFDLAKSEEPAKLLNNLFRKTIATPSVYWLPLTPEQVSKMCLILFRIIHFPYKIEPC